MIMLLTCSNFPDELSENDELREFELSGSDCIFRDIETKTISNISCTYLLIIIIILFHYFCYILNNLCLCFAEKRRSGRIRSAA